MPKLHLNRELISSLSPKAHEALRLRHARCLRCLGTSWSAGKPSPVVRNSHDAFVVSPACRA